MIEVRVGEEDVTHVLGAKVRLGQDGRRRPPAAHAEAVRHLAPIGRGVVADIHHGHDAGAQQQDIGVGQLARRLVVVPKHNRARRCGRRPGVFQHPDRVGRHRSRLLPGRRAAGAALAQRHDLENRQGARRRAQAVSSLAQGRQRLARGDVPTL